MSTDSAILAEITRFFLASHDFNGIPLSRLLEMADREPSEVLATLSELVQRGDVAVLTSKHEVNPHIIRLGFPPVDIQLAALRAQILPHACVYPRTQYLEKVLDRSQYDGRPYTLLLALGEPQLAYRSFDLSVLEGYRNDPRYTYSNDDVFGKISISDEFYESDAIPERDKVLLETFGFSYDEDLNRAVAVYIRYLANLSPEHQASWKAKELPPGYRLHPDYYRSSVLGEFGERLPILQALMIEIYIINRMSAAMGKPPLFRTEYGEYGETRPKRLGLLVRPTLEEFNAFVLSLDQVLSENLNKEFFRGSVELEAETVRKDGRVQVQQKGTLQLVDEWFRKYFRTYDWTPWDQSITSLRKLRKMRQRPAHTLDENRFDQEFFKTQRSLLIETYDAVRTVRLMLANHPAVRAAGVEVPEMLQAGLIWDR